MVIQTQPAENQFPANTMPENRLDLPSDISSLPFYRSYIMTGVYIQRLAAHFSDYTNIDDAVIRNRIQATPYTPDEHTGIAISTVSDWKPFEEDKRPAVLVRRGEVPVHRIGIGDTDTIDTTTGQINYVCMVGGTHIFFAIARTSAEADLLGFEVGRMLEGSKTLVDELDLERLQLISIGEAAQLEESKDHYAVPIVMAHEYRQSYSLAPHVPLLKRVSPIIQ